MYTNLYKTISVFRYLRSDYALYQISTFVMSMILGYKNLLKPSTQGPCVAWLVCARMCVAWLVCDHDSACLGCDHVSAWLSNANAKARLGRAHALLGCAVPTQPRVGLSMQIPQPGQSMSMIMHRLAGQCPCLAWLGCTNAMIRLGCAHALG